MSSVKLAGVPTAVRCLVCEGSGAEIVLTADGSIGVKDCFWCQGTGEIEQCEDPGVCPCCKRTMIPVTADESVCPECTAYLPALPESDPIDPADVPF